MAGVSRTDASGQQTCSVMEPMKPAIRTVSTQAPHKLDGFDSSQRKDEVISAGLNLNPLGWFQSKDHRAAKKEYRAQKKEYRAQKKDARETAKEYVREGQGSEYIKYLENLPHEFWPDFLRVTLEQCENETVRDLFLGSLEPAPLCSLFTGVADTEWVSTTYKLCSRASDAAGEQFINNVVSSFSPVQALNLQPELVNQVALYHLRNNDKDWFLEFSKKANWDLLNKDVIAGIYEFANDSEFVSSDLQSLKSRLKVRE